MPHDVGSQARAGVVGGELRADERRLRPPELAPARRPHDRAPAPGDAPVEVVRREEHQVAAEVTELAHEPVHVTGHVLLVPGEDDQRGEGRTLPAAPEPVEVGVGEVVRWVVPPRGPVQEVLVVLGEVGRDPAVEEGPVEADPQRDRSRLRSDVPRVAPAVAVRVLEVVGLPRVRGEHDGDVRGGAEDARPDDDRREALAPVRSSQLREVEAARDVADRHRDDVAPARPLPRDVDRISRREAGHRPARPLRHELRARVEELHGQLVRVGADAKARERARRIAVALERRVDALHPHDWPGLPGTRGRDGAIGRAADAQPHEVRARRDRRPRRPLHGVQARAEAVPVPVNGVEPCLRPPDDDRDRGRAAEPEADEGAVPEGVADPDTARTTARSATRTECHCGERPGRPHASLVSVPEFRASDAYSPTGDQPTAIAALAEGVQAGERYQTLLGATGTGKTATMAWVIEQVQKPALVIAHNKTLAAQLCNEKDSSQNDDIARLRLAATSALFTRRDVVVVASVSCIYGLGSPEEWRERVLILEVGEEHDRDLVLRKLIDSQYARNDTSLGRGRFRVKGDVVEIQPANSETAYRVSFFGDEVEQISHFDPLTGEVYARLDNVAIWPATEYVTSKPTIERAVHEIRHELEEQVKLFESQGKMLEAHRLRQRTEYDLEMLQELGFCSGIENYSRILEGRAPGTHPFTLLDYFHSDFVVFVDESHQTVPQLGGMYEGDRSRKQTLVDYGFRLPSALDNRPLRFDEFLGKVPQLLFVSATPGPFELRHGAVVAEQLIRPTGIVDPEVELRTTRNQIDDLLNEIRRREEAGERVLVTTLTKKMAEDLTDYLLESGLKARYLHSEIDTLERIQIIRELRLGEYDVLVGVNLLREGLDLPEVSLVAVLDADKEGFLRGKTALIQTIGRAARNVNGKVLLYADSITDSMKRAIDETNRRRRLQGAFNEENGITPQTIIKSLGSPLVKVYEADYVNIPVAAEQTARYGLADLSRKLLQLRKEMKKAAENLEFERAAELRDQIRELEQRELAVREPI